MLLSRRRQSIRASSGSALGMYSATTMTPACSSRASRRTFLIKRSEIAWTQRRLCNHLSPGPLRRQRRPQHAHVAGGSIATRSMPQTGLPRRKTDLELAPDFRAGALRPASPGRAPRGGAARRPGRREPSPRAKQWHWRLDVSSSVERPFFILGTCLGDFSSIAICDREGRGSCGGRMAAYMPG